MAYNHSWVFKLFFEPDAGRPPAARGWTPASVTRATFSTVKSAAMIALQPSVPNLIGVAKIKLFSEMLNCCFDDLDAFEELRFVYDEWRSKTNDVAVGRLGQ